jgi:hypothetical protein
MVTVTEKPCARSNLEEAVKAVHRTVLSKMGDVVVCVPAEPGKTQDTLFIMVDNSNMCVYAACTAGAWLLVIRCRECVRPCATCRHIGAQAKVGLEVVNIVHLKYAELMARVIQGRPTARKFAGGVMPDVVCRHWRQQGFSVRGGAKDDHGANIDDLLHAQILDTVTTEPVPGILVLLTGDGNINSGRTSFPRCVATALRLGWRVELYGWRAAMAMCYPAMAALSSGRMTVHYLDEWRREVCNGVPCHAPPWCVCESTLVCMWGGLACLAQITVETTRVRVAEGSTRGKVIAKLLSEDAGPAGAGSGGGGTAAVGAGVDSVVGAEPERSFKENLAMCEAVVRASMDTPSRGVLGSAFKAAFRNLHGGEVQFRFGGLKMQLKDILEASKVVRRMDRNTQPFYVYTGKAV